MESLRQLIDQSILEQSAKRYLPEGSSRQVVRNELYKRAYASLNEKFAMGRFEKRSIARSISHDLWKRGERLTAPKPL